MRYAQDFVSPWPTALDDIQEYVALTHMSLGKGRAGTVHVRLSRRRAPIDHLQPHVGEFRKALAAQLPMLRLTIEGAEIDAHHVDIQYN